MLACPALPQGLWFARVDWALVMVLLVVDMVALLCLYVYNQKLMRCYSDYVDLVRSRHQENSAFTQARDLFLSRFQLRGFIYAGFFLYVFIGLIKVIKRRLITLSDWRCQLGHFLRWRGLLVHGLYASGALVHVAVAVGAGGQCGRQALRVVWRQRREPFVQLFLDHILHHDGNHLSMVCV